MLILLIKVQLLVSLSEEIRPALPPSSQWHPPYQEYYHPLSPSQVLHLLSQQLKQRSCPHWGLGAVEPQEILQEDQQD